MPFSDWPIHTAHNPVPRYHSSDYIYDSVKDSLIELKRPKCNVTIVALNLWAS